VDSEVVVAQSATTTIKVSRVVYNYLKKIGEREGCSFDFAIRKLIRAVRKKDG